MATYSIFLPGRFPGQGSLAGYGPWSPEESDMTERLRWRLQLGKKGGNSGPQLGPGMQLQGGRWASVCPTHL